MEIFCATFLLTLMFRSKIEIVLENAVKNQKVAQKSKF